MKIYAISDLHLDLYDQTENEALVKLLPEADVLVCAGDFCNGKGGVNRFYNFMELAKNKYKYIIFTMGNHDHWGWDFKQSHEAFKSICDKQIHFLDNSFLKLPDYPDHAFYGGTLWYQKSHPFWIDERRTHNPSDIVKDNKVFKNNLELLTTGLSTSEPNTKLIVVSHHLPSNKCIAPAFVGADTNDYFVDPSCERLIKFIKPALWIHGHTHEYTDEMVENTRVYANPRGYDGEHDAQFLINALNRTIEI